MLKPPVLLIVSIAEGKYDSTKYRTTKKTFHSRKIPRYKKVGLRDSCPLFHPSRALGIP